jgi:ABC-type bacteriocin/lantibiotic exporter with double-glycine peptidase domain
MWIEDYIEKLYSDGMVKEARMMGASQEMVMSNWDEQAVASGANVPANLDMVAAELKKINYKLRKIVDRKSKTIILLQPFVLVYLLWA